MPALVYRVYARFLEQQNEHYKLALNAAKEIWKQTKGAMKAFPRLQQQLVIEKAQLTAIETDK